MLICEEFEDIVKVMPDPASYQALCEKVLPSLTGAFNVADVTSDNPLITVSWAYFYLRISLRCFIKLIHSKFAAT